MSDTTHHRRGELLSGVRSYAAWCLVTLAYAIAFMQRTAPQTINDYLSVDFNTNAQGVAAIASAYFVGYTIMQFPAGVLVDSYGPKKVILGSTLISAIGTLLFSMSHSVIAASLSRGIVAFGDALVFTCLVKLVALNFSDKTFGTMSGLSQLSGYIGGVVSTAPLALAVNSIGWRVTFGMLGLFLLAMLPLLWMTMVETSHQISVRQRLVAIAKIANLRIRQRASWGCALTFSTHFISITTLTGVWGIPMLMQDFGLTRTQASKPMMIMMIATMSGSFFFGVFSDRVRSIYVAQMFMVLIRTAGFAFLLPVVVKPLGLPAATVILGLLGFIGGGNVPFLLKSLKKIHTADTIGVGGSINTTTSGVLMVIAQPIVAYSLNAHGFSADVKTSVAHLSTLNFNGMIIVLTLFSLAGFTGPWLMKKAIT